MVTEVVALAEPPAVISPVSIKSDCCFCTVFACCSARRCRRTHLASYADNASAGVRSALMNMLARTKLFSDCLSNLAFLIRNMASSAEDKVTSIFCVRSATFWHTVCHLLAYTSAVFYCDVSTKFIVDHSGNPVLLITIFSILQTGDNDVI